MSIRPPDTNTKLRDEIWELLLFAVSPTDAQRALIIGAVDHILASDEAVCRLQSGQLRERWEPEDEAPLHLLYEAVSDEMPSPDQFVETANEWHENELERAREDDQEREGQMKREDQS